MRERSADLGGLHTTIVGDEDMARADVVLLHGHAMTPAALAPFAHSLRVNARFLIPQAPCAAVTGGYSWWPVDDERRRAQMAHGPRDLADTHPEGRTEARARMTEFVAAARTRVTARPLVVCGFSQGGMLACDSVLMGDLQVNALALLSSCRIAAAEWLTHCWKLRDLPVLVSHGAQDDDLAFSAGEALRNFLVDAGAKVTWVPFDAGHVIPLSVWRQLKRLVDAVT